MVAEEDPEELEHKGQPISHSPEADEVDEPMDERLERQRFRPLNNHFSRCFRIISLEAVAEVDEVDRTKTDPRAVQPEEREADASSWKSWETFHSELR